MEGVEGPGVRVSSGRGWHGGAQELVVVEEGGDHVKVRLGLDQLRRHHAHLVSKLVAAPFELVVELPVGCGKRDGRGGTGPGHLLLVALGGGTQDGTGKEMAAVSESASVGRRIHHTRCWHLCKASRAGRPNGGGTHEVECLHGGRADHFVQH